MRITAEIGSAASARYANLSRDEMEVYVNMARDAIEMYKDGVRHPLRAPTYKYRKVEASSTGDAIAVALPSGEPPAGDIAGADAMPGVDAVVVVDASEAAIAVGIVDIDSHPLVLKARREAKQVREENRLRKAGEDQLQLCLQAHSERLLQEDVDYDVVGVRSSDGVRQNVVDAHRPADNFTVFTTKMDEEHLIAETLRALDIGGVEASAKRWRHDHHLVEHLDCPQLGKVDTTPNPCFEAGYCVDHCEDGLKCKKLKNNLMIAQRIVEHIMGTRFNEVMKDGNFALRITLRSPLPADYEEYLFGDLEDDDQEQVGLVELYYKVSLQYEKPWRPTYTEMVRCPEEDREHCTGLTPKRWDQSHRRIRWRTLWEVLVDYRFHQSGRIDLSWHEFFADGRKVTQMRPRLQRILSNPIFTCDLWTVKRPPPKPRKKKGGGVGDGKPIVARPSAVEGDKGCGKGGSLYIADGAVGGGVDSNLPPSPARSDSDAGSDGSHPSLFPVSHVPCDIPKKER